MTDTYDEQLLLDFVEGELGPEDRARVEKLIARDERLGRLLEDMRRDRDTLRQLPEPPTPTWLMDEALGSLERTMLLEPSPDETEARVNHKRGVLRRLSFTAAVAAMLLLCTFVVFQSLTNLAGPDVAFHSEGEHEDSEPILPGKGGPMIAKSNARAEQAPANPDVQSDPIAVHADRQSDPGTTVLIAKGGPAAGRQEALGQQAEPEIAVQQRAITSRAGTQQDVAQVAKAGPSAPGPQVHQLIVETPEQFDLASLVNEEIQLSPEEIAALEVVVNTNDVTLTNDQLISASAHLPQTNLIGPLTTRNGQKRVDPVDAQYMAQVSYKLEIPTDQFNNWVRNVSQVERQKQVRAGQRVVFQRRYETMDLARTWPRSKPDYNAILTEQLPLLRKTKATAVEQSSHTAVQAQNTKAAPRDDKKQVVINIPVYVNNDRVQAVQPTANRALEIEQTDAPPGDAPVPQTE